MSKPCILLVEDEAPLLALLTRYLERKGYTVAACETGQQALGRFENLDEAPQLVVLDLTLPDLAGEEVLERLLSRSPDVKVLISSGRPFAVEALPETVQPRVGAILKPYLPQMLLDEIARLIGTPDSI